MSRRWIAQKKLMSRERLIGNDALLSVFLLAGNRLLPLVNPVFSAVHRRGWIPGLLKHCLASFRQIKSVVFLLADNQPAPHKTYDNWLHVVVDVEPRTKVADPFQPSDDLGSKWPTSFSPVLANGLGFGFRGLESAEAAEGLCCGVFHNRETIPNRLGLSRGFFNFFFRPDRGSLNV